MVFSVVTGTARDNYFIINMDQNQFHSLSLQKTLELVGAHAVHIYKFQVIQNKPHYY